MIDKLRARIQAVENRIDGVPGFFLKLERRNNMAANRVQNTDRPSKHRGNAMVIFIIIVLIAVGAVFLINSSTQDPVGPVEQYPWCEIDRINAAAVNLPHAPQVTLKEMSMVHPITSEDGQPRGQLEIEITPDGAVVAVWKANYKEDVFEKEVSATCAGNVDASKLYEDENGATDESKLFFITEGKFIIQAFQQGNAIAGGGKAYVVGWIAPDETATGTLVLAPDKKTTKIYRWGK